MYYYVMLVHLLPAKTIQQYKTTEEEVIKELDDIPYTSETIEDPNDINYQSETVIMSDNFTDVFDTYMLFNYNKFIAQNPAKTSPLYQNRWLMICEGAPINDPFMPKEYQNYIKNI